MTVPDNTEPNITDQAVTAEAVPLFGEEFRLDPQGLYERLRGMWGSVAPVLLGPGLPAWLVLGYYEVVGVCRGRLFSRDTRYWADLRDGLVPPGTPVPAELIHRPGLAFAEGEDHARLRACLTDALERLDASGIARRTQEVAGALLDAFGPLGRADLVGQYARLLPPYVLAHMLGVPQDRVGPFAGALVHSAEQGAADALARELAALVQARREEPWDDLTSRLLEHPAGLTDEEVTGLLGDVVRRGDRPAADLLAGTLRRLVTEGVSGNAATGPRVDDTIEQVLRSDPPVHNAAPRVAAHDALLGRAEIVAGDLLLMGFAAANADPGTGRGEGPGASGRRAHLGWGAGPYRCPAQRAARQIVSIGAGTLLTRLRGVRLAIPEARLERRDAPLAPGLAALPVVFPATQAEAPDRTLPSAELVTEEHDPEPEFVNPFRQSWWHHS